jgi:hypothetical protein
MAKTKLASVKKIEFHRWRFFGIGIGWDPLDSTFCVMLIFWNHTLVLGPHK